MKRRFFWLTPWLSWTLRATPALVLSATIMPVVAQTTSQQAIRLNNDALREHYRGNYAAALQLYNAAIASADGNKWFFFNRAATQLELENFDDALKDLSRALSLGIDEDRVESQRSRVFLGKGDLKTALATSNRAISLNPGSGFSYNNRGLIHFTARRFPQAIADFNRAVELGLTGPEVLINRSTALRLNKQFADALADATEALAIAPDYEAAYLERARIYLAQKQTRKALSDLDKAIRMNPRNSDA
jgi:tetratricopeptide (TPR) repeat protein